MFERIHTLLGRISRYAVWAGGAALLVSAFIVTIDVICRKLFSITMSGSDEISGYVFAASTTWAFSYCLLHRANVRIDAAYNVMPIAVRAVLDLVGVLLLLGYMLILTDQAISAFLKSWERNSVSITTLATPQWIPQLFWVAGLCLFVVTLVFVALYSFVSLVRRDFVTVQKVAGVLSMDEEIEEELQGHRGAHGRHMEV